VTFRLVWIPVSMMLQILPYNAAGAGELEELRAAFDKCNHHDGPAVIHPPDPRDDPEVKFFFLADIDKCDGSPLTKIRHFVVNLQPTRLTSFGSLPKAGSWGKGF
jgi:hypothetical protein